jgi:subtilisin-like proprotein convertase family protein
MKKVMILALLAVTVVFLGSAIAQDEVKDPSQIGRRGAPAHPYVPSLPSPFCSQPGTVITDGAPFTDTIVIPDGFVITDLNVLVDISHTWLSDLEISIDNGGAPVGLTWDDCGSNDDMVVTFDDAGPPLSTICAQPTIGTAATTTNDTQEFLSVFNGMNINGSWNLNVNDDAGGDDGVLNEWCIITTPIPVELKGFEVE